VARARGRILDRIERLREGNFGDCEPVGDDVFELRMFFGPGYSVYFMNDGADLVILLCGGTKSSQNSDIRKAKMIAENWRDQ
jgi:putative addiction module killer protein